MKANNIKRLSSLFLLTLISSIYFQQKTHTKHKTEQNRKYIYNNNNSNNKDDSKANEVGGNDVENQALQEYILQYWKKKVFLNAPFAVCYNQTYALS